MGSNLVSDTEGPPPLTLPLQFPCVAAVNTAGASTAPPVNRKSLFKPRSRAKHVRAWLRPWLSARVCVRARVCLCVRKQRKDSI